MFPSIIVVSIALEYHVGVNWLELLSTMSFKMHKKFGYHLFVYYNIINKMCAESANDAKGLQRCRLMSEHLVPSRYVRKSEKLILDPHPDAAT